MSAPHCGDGKNDDDDVICCGKLRHTCLGPVAGVVR